MPSPPEPTALPSADPFDPSAVVRWLLEEARPRALIDVGAYVGGFSTALRELGFDGPVLSIEPLAESHAKLLANAAADDRWQVAPRTAVGAGAGEVAFNVAANAQSSSLLPMLELHQQAAPFALIEGSELTPVARLDDIVEELQFDPTDALLKIDTQGYEHHVLAGAPKTLERVAAVHLELSFLPLYDGQARPSEVVSQLAEVGLELTQISRCFNAPDGRALQVDAVFARSALPM